MLHLYFTKYRCREVMLRGPHRLVFEHALSRALQSLKVTPASYLSDHCHLSTCALTRKNGRPVQTNKPQN